MNKSWTFVALITYLGLVQSKTFKAWKSVTGTCDFEEYQPGPRNIEIQKTTAPTATLQTNAMQKIFTHADTGIITGTLGIGDSTIGIVGDLSKKFAKTASVLAPCLGIFVGIMGTIIGDLTPTADDILDATNKAIEKLAEEVDDRLEEMREYVDEKVVDLEKDITDRKYIFLFTYWSKCVKERSANEVNLCQREAYRLMDASLSEFALFHEKLDKSTFQFTAISDDERRRIEVNLISFRNYVQLSLMCLKVLASTYKTDTSDSGQEMYNKYHDELTAKATFYEEYVKAAVREVEALNTEYGSTFQGNFRTDVQENYSRRSMNTGGHYFYKEYERKCSTVLAPLMVTRRCTAHVFINLISNSGWNKKSRYTNVNLHAHDSNAADVYCRQLLQQKQDSFRSATRQAVQEYWQMEVLKVVTCGKTLATGEAKECS